MPDSVVMRSYTPVLKQQRLTTLRMSALASEIKHYHDERRNSLASFCLQNLYKLGCTQGASAVQLCELRPRSFADKSPHLDVAIHTYTHISLRYSKKPYL